MTRIKIHFVYPDQWLSPSREAPCEPLQVRNSPWYLYLIFCLICSQGSNRAGDDGGKGSTVCKGRRASTSVSLSHHAIPACHSRRESLSPLLREITQCQIAVKSKSLLFKDKEFIRILNRKTLTCAEAAGKGCARVQGSRGKEKWVKQSSAEKGVNALWQHEIGYDCKLCWTWIGLCQCDPWRREGQLTASNSKGWSQKNSPSKPEFSLEQEHSLSRMSLAVCCRLQWFLP